MAKTGNSFGSDRDSGIVIWKHHTMGHMDNGVEEAIAGLIKKQQEGLINSQSQVSFASESYATEKPKKGFLKRFLGLGKKDSSDGRVEISSSLIQDKSSSFESIRSGRSRGSSYEESKATADFRVFRDGKGAAVVARADGRNFKDLAKKAKEAGFPDLARQLEKATPRQPKTSNQGSFNSKASTKHQNSTKNQATAAEIIDRVRARNVERLGRSASGKSSEAERYGEIPIRSAADLLAHRAELAQESRRMSSLQQAQAAVLNHAKKKKAPEEAARGNIEVAESANRLERTAMVANWLHFGNITGNPVLYPEDCSEAPAQIGKAGSEAPIPDLLEIEDRVLFNQKQAEEGLHDFRGDNLNGEVPSTAVRQPDQRLCLEEEGTVPDGPALRARSSSKSPLVQSVKSPEQRFGGKSSKAEKLVLPRTASSERSNQSASALETSKARLSEALRPSVKGSPLPWGSESPLPLSRTPEMLSPLVSPRFDIGKSENKWTVARLPTEVTFHVPQVPTKATPFRQTTGKAYEDGLEGDGEHYNPAQWHKYLKSRSAQVLPNLSDGEEVPAPKALQPAALPLPLPPDLHPLPLAFSLGPPNWPHKRVESSDYNVSGGATPRSPASSLSEPRSPSSPLRSLLLSPQTAHMLGPWPVPPAYNG